MLCPAGEGDVGDVGWRWVAPVTLIVTTGRGRGRRRVQFPGSAVITGRWGGRTVSGGRTWGHRGRVVSTRPIVS